MSAMGQQDRKSLRLVSLPSWLKSLDLQMVARSKLVFTRHMAHFFFAVLMTVLFQNVS
jgi:hypothetical protein